MAGEIEYKCPNCGASLKFDAKSQKIVCEYCGSEFDPQQVKKYNEELSKPEEKLDWGKETTKEFSKDELSNLNVYTCDSCGGEIIADENTSATSCPYCGNPIILKGRLQGALKPDYVIPFKNTKDDLVPVLKKYLNKKLFLPGKFKTENQIKEVKGLYVPFWIHDADVSGRVIFKGHKTKRYVSGKYEVTERSYYSLIREGNLGFEHIPVDGSVKMPDELMESIEPFNFKEAVKFEPMYLTGYLSDKYDVDKEQVFPRVNERIKEGTIDQFRTTVSSSYSGVSCESTNLSLYNTHVDYALYPVWTMTTQWKDKSFLFAMNGQTNKMTGNLPVSGLKAFLLSLIVFLIPALAIFFIWFFNNEMEVNPLSIAVSAGVGLIIALVFLAINIKALKPVKFQRGAANYIKEGSFNLTRREDIFLYKTVNKIEISTSKK